jgi:tricorn protease
MHKWLLAGLTLGILAASHAGNRWIRNPDIHDGRIVFTCEGDLWAVPASGGSAVRLTAHPGTESLARFSPDGKWIAFTASYDGGVDVYVMPSTGGEPRRLTFHPANDDVIDWTPDGRFILFSSPRAVDQEVWRVPLAGGPQTPVRIDLIRHASFAPDGRRIVFTRSDADRMHWRGYKGGAQPDVWLADLSAGTFERLTDYRGFDIRPMWHRESVYFLSDRDGRMNLYALPPKSRNAVRKTNHSDSDAEDASIGGDAIVYVCGGSLRVYDIPSGRDRAVVVDIPSDRWLTRETWLDPSDDVQAVALSHDGRAAVVQARGDAYWIGPDGVRNLTGTPDSNELLPALSPDGKWVAFFSDRTGAYELYVTAPDGAGEWKKLSSGFDAWPYRPLWSPDSRKIVFGDHLYGLWLADREAGTSTRVDRTRYQKDNEITWETAEYDWSPDSKWIAYSKCESNMNSSIFLYDLEASRIVRVTDDRYDDTWPAFDRNGGFLYFLSLRNFDPLLDPFMDNHINGSMSVVLAAGLRRDGRSPFENETEDGATPVPEAAAEPFRVDPEGLGDRLFAAPVPAGTYTRLQALKNGFCVLSKDLYGFPGWDQFIRPTRTTDWTLLKFTRSSRRFAEILTNIGTYTLSGDGSKAAYLSGFTAGSVGMDGESLPGDGSFDWCGYRQKIDPGREYGQILRTVWNQIRLFFYDPDLHGVDWRAVRGRYEAMIPWAANRSELNGIIGGMIGELGVSHEYVLDPGDESRIPRDRTVGVGLLGCDFEPDPASGRVRISRIVAGRSWDESLRSPLESAGTDVRPGDFLLAVDGLPVSAGEDVYSYFAGKAGKKTVLTVNAKPDTAGSRRVEVKTLVSETALREAERIEANYRRVREASGGKAGYIHLSDMDEKGFREFEQGFRAERYRDALIVDVRGNGGGFIAWFVLDKLERRLAFFSRTRDFEPMRYPHAVHPGPLVFLCDENTASDGELFIELVKKSNLGPVIGTDTWGGLVGITNMIPAADGGLVSQSNVGFYDPDRGTWLVENRGARPDTLTENRPEDKIAGRDRPLEKAVKTALDLLKRNPAAGAKVPVFPKR